MVYSDMQLVCEAYHLLKEVVTQDIFTKMDIETGKWMVDIIKDSADQKGTGKWTSQNALDLGVPLSVITESVFMRYLSTLGEERKEASALFDKPKIQVSHENRTGLIELVRKALYASKICSYAQGFAQMKMVGMFDKIRHLPRKYLIRKTS